MKKSKIDQVHFENDEIRQKKPFVSSLPVKVTLFVLGVLVLVICVFVAFYAFGTALNWISAGAGDQAMGPLVIVLAIIFPLPIGIGATILAAFVGSLLLASIYAKDKPPN